MKSRQRRMNFVSHSPKETQKYSLQVLNFLKQNIIALNGELGSGKTTFVQGLAKHLGITKRITSPTYILMRTYSTKHPKYKNLFHFDLYRLNSAQDLKSVDLQEIIDNKKNLVVIEWAQKAKKNLPKSTLWLNFKSVNKNTRKINLRSTT